MPYKKEYNKKTVGKGASKTPNTVMGSQGNAVSIPSMHHKQKATGHTKFPKKK